MSRLRPITVSVLAVRPFIAAVAERGVSCARFLCAAGIDPRRLDEVDGRLEASELDRLHETALASTGDPALGIHMAERARPAAYDVVGHIPPHSASLRESLECSLAS